MGSDLLLYLGILLAGFSVLWTVYTIFSVNEDSKALSWATGDQPDKSESPIINLSRPLVHQLTIKYARRIKRKSFRDSVDYKIMTAGLDNELNADEFIGLKILWGIFFPIFVGILNFSLQLGYPWIVIALAMPLGWMIPDFHANKQKQIRYQAIIIDLPFFVDLLALSTQAGADFMGAIQKISDAAEDSLLAKEFDKVLRDTRLGSTREQSLKSMARRLDIPEVTSFVNVLTDADATGASIGDVLKEQSEQMRLERFVRAEKAGARASQAILLPMMMFIIPAVFIMVFAPVGLQFIYGGQ
jgi:tight adherence protein C